MTLAERGPRAGEAWSEPEARCQLIRSRNKKERDNNKLCQAPGARHIGCMVSRVTVGPAQLSSPTSAFILSNHEQKKKQF